MLKYSYYVLQEALNFYSKDKKFVSPLLNLQSSQVQFEIFK